MIGGLAAAALSSALPCVLPPGWAAIEARETPYVIFGEIHGAAQSPAMVGAVACGLAAKHERVLVAVELSAEGNDALQAAWAGPQADFAATIDRTMPDWKGRRDGVASRAMHALLVRLHALKAAGAAIDVVAFSPGAPPARFKTLPGQGPIEAGQAENIRRAADAGAYDRVLILVGNLHARKVPVERGAVSWRPMAMHLAPAKAVISLDMTYSGGTMWNCKMKPGSQFTPGKPIPDDAIACGAYPTRGTGGSGQGPRVGLGRMPGVDEPAGAYDGYYWLGAVSSSPPYSARATGNALRGAEGDKIKPSNR